MNIVRANDPSFSHLWDALARKDELQYPLLSTLDVEYSKAYAADSRFEDVSFVIEEQQTPLLGARLAVRTYPDGRLELSGFGRPIAYLEAGRIDPARRDGAAGVLREELQALLQRLGSAGAWYLELQPALSPLGRCLLDAGAKARPRFTQIIDLAPPETALRSQVRKSYKSLINWGEKHLQLQLLDHSTVTAETMEGFRLLHVEVAGRETRSRRSWELQYEMVRQKEAFAILGRMDGMLVTAALFVHSPKYCCYGVSASKRELHEKPLGHCVLWKAILHARFLGCRWFETGEQLFPGHSLPPPTAKELGISAFKKGFGGDTLIRLDLQLVR